MPGPYKAQCLVSEGPLGLLYHRLDRRGKPPGLRELKPHGRWSGQHFSDWVNLGNTGLREVQAAVPLLQGGLLLGGEGMQLRASCPDHASL